MKYDIDMDEFKKRHNKEERIRSNIKLIFKVFLQGCVLILICNLLIDWYNCLGKSIDIDNNTPVTILVTLTNSLIIIIYGVVTQDNKDIDNINNINYAFIPIIIIGMKLIMFHYQSWGLICIFSIMVIFLILFLINVIFFVIGNLTYEDLITVAKADLIIIIPSAMLLIGYVISII